MRKFLTLIIVFTLPIICYCQTYNIDSSLNSLQSKKDSTLHALKWQRDSSYQASFKADSARVQKEYDDAIKWEKLKSVAIHPALNAGDNSGVIPVKDLTEIPDPKLEYKLLFELTAENQDSLAREINWGLAEVARVINLHVAAGIPLKKIHPVIVLHGGALHAISTNAYYQKHYKMDNPNIRVVNDLVKIGATFIACAQAMTFIEVKKEDLLPVSKISLSAQTVLSMYQLKGYVKYSYHNP